MSSSGTNGIPSRAMPRTFARRSQRICTKSCPLRVRRRGSRPGALYWPTIGFWTLRTRLGWTCSLPGPIAIDTLQSHDGAVQGGVHAQTQRDHAVVTTTGSHPDCRTVLIQIVALLPFRFRRVRAHGRRSKAPRCRSNADVRSSGGSCSDADAVTHCRASSCVGCVKRHSQAAGRRAWDACSNMALALRLQRRWEGREVLSLPSWPFSRLVAAAGQPGQDGGTSLDCPATPASTQIGKMPVTPQRSVAGPARRSLHAVSAATSADPAAAAPSHRQSR
jgi:hypothetical protein